MSAEPDDVAAAAAEDAAFASGFPSLPPEKGKSDAKPAEEPAKVEAKAPEPAGSAAPQPAAVVVEKPEYVQISKKDWDDIKARTASHEGSFAKAFGTIGNISKTIASLQGQTPAGRKVEVPKAAFEKMSKDFPELADQMRDAMEQAFAGVTGTGPAAEADTGKYEAWKAERAAEKVKEQLEELEDAYPAWRQIVGAVDASKQAPDPNNPFRKWLAGKDAAYQARLNASDSAAVISRAIRTFEAETKGTRAAAPAKPGDDARANRIREAVQPRGDNAGAAAGKSADQEFEEGFNSR